MSNPEPITAEMHIGQALAIIHRILPRLEDAARVTEIQAGLQRAIVALKHAGELLDGAGTAPVIAASAGPGEVAPEIVAVIAAAVAVVLDRPHRVLAVRQVNVPETISHVNVWAFEGRTQIFTSHKVR